MPLAIQNVYFQLSKDVRINLQLFINLNPNKFSHQIHYHVYMVKLDRFFGRCNTLNYLSNKACVPNKTEDLTYF